MNIPCKFEQNEETVLVKNDLGQCKSCHSRIIPAEASGHRYETWARRSQQLFPGGHILLWLGAYYNAIVHKKA